MLHSFKTVGEMNAEELDDLLDDLPDAEQWTPPPSLHPAEMRAPPPSKPSRWAQPVFRVDPSEIGNSASARASSAAIVASLASVPGRVPTLAGSEWSQAQEAASRFRADHEIDSRGSARFVDLSTGLRVRCHCWGEPSQCVNVIILHDVSESGGSYCGLGRALAGRGYGVFAPDLRGHGDSAWSTEGQYSPAALSDDLESLIIELDLYVRPVVLVGFGLGGGVAAALASRNPHLVGAVCLVDSAPSAPLDSWRFHPLQAAVFENQKQAVEFLCAHTCWGHRPRSGLYTLIEVESS